MFSTIIEMWKDRVTSVRVDAPVIPAHWGTEAGGSPSPTWAASQLSENLSQNESVLGCSSLQRPQVQSPVPQKKKEKRLRASTQPG